MNLVIVESPAKAKTINKYLGKDYKVIASFGHVRDLPSKNGSVLPEENFALKYVISEKATKHVEEILKYAASCQNIYLATDPDREGESISWHIAEVIREKIPNQKFSFKRIAFNEITQKAVKRAVSSPRDIDANLVEAQQARRALDYLVGFTLSPILWRKLPGCRSAGRVQSVALRLVCDREEEIEAFKSQEYWDITLKMESVRGEVFNAKLNYADGHKLEKFTLTDEEAALAVVKKLKNEAFTITKIEKKQQKRTPPAPFITSSLQQEAARKLGFSAKKTMQIAQKLYEGLEIKGETIGLITYMRTDGVTLADEAVTDIRKFIDKNYGPDYLPSVANKFKTRAKNAQEAHEAIRPTDIKLKPANLESSLEKDQYRLYDLIWKRTLACQMENVIIDLVNAEISTEDSLFKAKAVGSTIKFDGFYKLYKEDFDDSEDEENHKLPELNEGEPTKTKNITPNQHFTQAPPRYTESSLVKKLEEFGIGRPSTYATILSVLQDREYVKLLKKRFVPVDRGRLVTTFLVGFFSQYVGYSFTANLENELDAVAEGKANWKVLLKSFWDGFSANIEIAGNKPIAEVIKYVENALSTHLFSFAKDGDKTCPGCMQGQLELKLSKFGAFLACNKYPDCNFKKQIASADSEDEFGSDQNHDRIVGQDVNANNIILKKGPYGWYLQLGESNAKTDKPKRVPVPAKFAPNDIDQNLASKIISLPILIGNHPEDNNEIHLGIGRFGPYLRYNNKFTSIPKKFEPFDVDLIQSIEILQAAKLKLAKKAKQEESEDKVSISSKKPQVKRKATKTTKTTKATKAIKTTVKRNSKKL